MFELADMLDMIQLSVYDINGGYMEPSLLSMISIPNSVEMLEYINLKDMITLQIILYLQISIIVIIIHFVELYIMFSFGQ